MVLGDGHDVEQLSKVLNDLKDIDGPKILHCLTVKGKGYTPAERGDTTMACTRLLDKKTGSIIKGNGDKSAPKYQDVFGETIIELAKENEKIVGVTPAMLTGSSLKQMMEVMPDRTFDVGIAKRCCNNIFSRARYTRHHSFCNIYSTFMQRAYDQVIHDVAIQKLKCCVLP